MPSVISGDANVSATEFGYLDGVTSALQTQLDAKLALAGGKILQTVSATHSTEVSTTSTSFVTTNITASITPSSASNKVLILSHIPARNSTSAAGIVFTLFRGTVAGTNLGNGNFGTGIFFSAGGDLYGIGAITFLDSPNTTSAQAYTIGMRVGAGTTARSCADGSLASIVLMEVSA